MLTYGPEAARLVLLSFDDLGELLRVVSAMQNLPAREANREISPGETEISVMDL